ncbi:hypothetical protein SAMN04487907_101138 [Zunongwangia mangrovi]|uniref:3-keto-disaccharide hydrolase domain-containing protein n=1 Tax=Zunongwangia mangrovi TaxID=1334022 RepID=A0A1I1DBL2_9FLAO|nr:hypothetical protein [Zunongwangia mangrovi]SFB69933.1 hypothetical protein SAMN04487907_101138 [Zunongwangia mangrovi]
MINIKDALIYRIRPILFKKINKKVKNNFQSDNKSVEYFDVKETTNIKSVEDFFEFKDNSWSQIKYIENHMLNDLTPFKVKDVSYENDNVCDNSKVEFLSDGIIKCFHEGVRNEWVLLKYRNKLQKPYIFEFDAKINTVNSEFQIAFNFDNLGKRYRFNFRHNEKLSFEVVYKGFFHNHICSQFLKVDLGVYNNFKIIVCNNYYQYIVNDNVILSVKEKEKLFNASGLALILWDNDGNLLDVSYKNMKILEI